MKHPAKSRPRRHRLCAMCGVRPANYRRNGQTRRRGDHTLCQQCFRSVSEHNKQLHPKHKPIPERTTNSASD